MKRGGPLHRRTPLRRSNPTRARQRLQESFGPQADLCRASPCAVPECAEGPPCDPDHVRTRGAGGTDSDTVPLCRRHHDERHRWGIVTFQDRYGLDLAGLARVLADQVRQQQADEAVGE